jgi:DNA (cytosine-5)-methyltransferase 1
MRALDLFCCAGGATRGLQQAGYHVTGVDVRPQPRYIGDAFHQDDAMAWLRGEREPLCSFDLIWASPPCQRYSQITPKERRESHPDLLPVALELLRAQPVPYIVENVQGTQQLMRNPVMLCGSMFGLRIQRHRWFEVGNSDAFFLLPPCDHSEPPVLITGTTRRLTNGKRREFSLAECKAAAGIDWMRREDLDEAIPPAYAKFLAEQIRAASHGAAYDPITHHGYTAPWRVEAPGGPAWFGTLAEVERWAERRER